MSATVIEIRPHRNGWKVFEARPGWNLFSPRNVRQSIAQNRACFRSGEIRIWIRAAMSNGPFCLTKRFECCDALGVTPHVAVHVQHLEREANGLSVATI